MNPLTFAGRRAAVVLHARAVLPLEVVGTFADVFGRQVETAAAVLTRAVEAVIDIQLWGTGDNSALANSPFPTTPAHRTSSWIMKSYICKENLL